MIQIHTDLKWINTHLLTTKAPNNYKMINTKYQKIKMQSIVFVTLRIPNDKTEVSLTKK